MSKTTKSSSTSNGTRGGDPLFATAPRVRSQPLVGFAAALVVCATVLAFLNSFPGDFVLDDVAELIDNPVMRRLWPPFELMFVGRGLPARPLPYLTFAIDHAIWDRITFGYHLTNLAIHVIAALALFDLARRTLSSPRLAAACGRHATGLALAIAVLWAVHPLQTQAVTYVYQRIESMAGMFVLLSLAAFARAAFGGWGRGWLAASAAAAVAAAFSKETAVVLPLLVLAYDWTFVARDGREIARRWRWYALLASTWAIVASLLWFQQGAYGEFRKQWHGGPIGYAVTQPGVILHYLRLAFWPSGQCFDYEWPPARTAGEILPPLAVILAALFATAVGLRRRSPWAWLGAAFFLTLAPSSSIVPVMAMAAEHRMYLPLAAVVATIVIGTHAALALAFDRPASGDAGRRCGWAGAAMLAAAAVAVVLGIATARRNELYHDRQSMWEDVLSKAPSNYRVHTWMAGFCHEQGDLAGAIRHAEAAVASRPTCDIFAQLAKTRSKRGDYATSDELYARGIAALERELPDDRCHRFIARYVRASTHLEQRRYEEASRACEAIVDPLAAALGDGDPATVGCRNILAAAANNRGDPAAAERLAAKNLAASKAAQGGWHTGSQVAAVLLASALEAQGRAAEAERLLRQLLAEIDAVAWWRTVDTATTLSALAALLERRGRHAESIAFRERMLREARDRYGPDAEPTRRAARALQAAAEAHQERPMPSGQEPFAR